MGAAWVQQAICRALRRRYRRFFCHGRSKGCTEFSKLHLSLVPLIAAEVQASMCCFCETDDLLPPTDPKSCRASVDYGYSSIACMILAKALQESSRLTLPRSLNSFLIQVVLIALIQWQFRWRFHCRHRSLLCPLETTTQRLRKGA